MREGRFVSPCWVTRWPGSVRKAAGILAHGAVRDVDELAHIELGVCALGSVPARGSKSGVGACDVALSIRGVQVKPGDFMAIDADGVVFTDEPPTAA